MSERYATISKIVYRTAVGRTDAETVPLGVIAKFSEAGANNPAVLLLLARPSLSPDERKRLDWIAKRTLANPAAFLRSALDDAVAQDAPDIFSFLGERFQLSVHITAPVEVAVPEDLYEAVVNSRRHRAKGQRSTSRTIARKASTTRSAADSDDISARDAAMKKLASLAVPDFPKEMSVPSAWMIDGITRLAAGR